MPPSLRDHGLKLSVGVLPKVDEPGEIVDRLGSLSLRLIQMAETKVRPGQKDGICLRESRRVRRLAIDWLHDPRVSVVGAEIVRRLDVSLEHPDCGIRQVGDIERASQARVETD